MNQTQKHTTGKKLLALLLALIMSVSLLPISVFAADLGTEAPIVEGQTQQGVEDAALDESSSEEEIVDSQEPVEDVQEPAEDETDVTDADTQAAEGDVAVQADDSIYTQVEEGKAKSLPAPAKNKMDYRIVHIDCGRKYFSADDLKKIIDYAYEYGYTHVELAFGNDGLRFLLKDMSVGTYTSDQVSAAIQAGNDAFDNAARNSNLASKTEELNETDMNEIIAYANGKGIGIIPMFDAPGHLYAVITAMRSLGLTVTSSNPSNSGSSPNWAINPTDTASISFVQTLMQKYITYFAGKGCTMFNIAADECGFSNMNNNTYTAYAKLVNSMAAMVQNAGMVALAFNDGINYANLTSDVQFDTNIGICYWTAGSNYATAASLADNGFKIVNTNTHWYYVIGKEDGNLNGDWNDYAYYLNYAVKNMSTANSAFKVDGDTAGVVTPVGCMAAVWCDNPSSDVNDSNLESYVKALQDGNGTYFVKAAAPEVVSIVDSTGAAVSAMKVGDSVTLSLSSGDEASWSVEPAGVIELSSAATRAATTGTSVTAKALKAGEATVTATVDGTKYTQDITVQDVGDETYTSEKTINLVIGETKDVTISGKNLSTDGKTYVTKDPDIATVTVTGEDEKPGDLKYDRVSVSYSTLAGNNSSWTKTQYFYLADDGEYYPVYAYRYYYYYYGYSITDSASSVQQIGNRSNNGSRTVNVYEQSGAQTVPASTTLTFEGVNEGTTTVVIDNVLYKITVTKEDTTNVSALPIQTWITNYAIETGSTTSENYWAASWSADTNNQYACYVNIAAADVYGPEGKQISECMPNNLTRYEFGGTYWEEAKDNKAAKELVVWSGRVHSSSNVQKIYGKDYSNTGTEFNYVRYYGGKWEVSATGLADSWVEVKGTNTQSTEQIAVYYMMRSKITTEVTTDVADWGYIKSDDNYSTQITAKQYVILDFAVKYEEGTRNPATFPQDGKTFVFHCTPNDASGSVIEESSNVYYRQLNNFRGVNTSDYEIYMVTVTMTNDSVSETIADTTDYSYNGKERIVWAIDEKTRDDSNFEEYQAITNNDTTYSGCKIGGDPYVRGVEVYNQHGALITYYIRSRAVEGQLTVHYIDKASNNEFYRYNITIGNIDDMDQRFKGTIRLNPDNWKGNLLDGSVVNKWGVTQTVSSDLSTMPGVPAGYRYAISYRCEEVTHNTARTDVYLYYEFVSGKTFVVDFGLPLKITPKDFSDELENATLEKVSVSDSAYAAITTDNELNVIYTLNKTIDGEDNITVGYNGKIKVITEEGSKEQTGFVSYTVTIIPASTVYYEDSFATFYDAGSTKAKTQFTQTTGTDVMGTWYVDGETKTADQALEELGNKQNVYGYDPAYTQNNSTTFSMGSAKKVTVNADVTTNPTAQFTFKGTGFDVISLTDNRSGAIFVDVYKGKDTTGEMVKSYIVDNYYGYKQETVGGKTTWVVDKESTDCLYQIPVMKITGLDYGEYTAVITVFYDGAFDHDDTVGYSFWLDAIRVYDPMGKDRSEYTQGNEKEGYPQYIKLRDKLAKSGGVTSDAVFIDGGSTANISIYANYGPNNEVYLAAGQAISFKVAANDAIASIQIGAKAPQNSTDAANMSISVNGVTAKTEQLTSATEMYYRISDTVSDDTSVTITNTTGSVLSLTNLKITFTKEATAELAQLTTLEQTEAVAAVRALFAAPVEPEPDPEPVTFEPDRFEVRWNRSTVKVGQKATLTVKTSEDVEAITVDGETVTSYRTRTQRTGWGWNAKKVTYREFTYTVTAAEAGTLNYSVVATDADGVNSEAFNAPALTVQAASQRPGIGGWLDNIFGRWF